MGRSSSHLIAVLVLIAALSKLSQTDQAIPERPTINSKESSVQVTRISEPPIEKQKRRVTERNKAAARPKKTTVHVRQNPLPSGTQESTIPNQVLSIRNISLGMTQSSIRSIHPGPEVVDRIKDYWGPGYRDEARMRFGATWYSYPTFHASFDREGICGAVIGDGLERNGIPILARGDSGKDVERLLGKPNGSYISPFGRGTGTEWSYHFTDKSDLIIQFTGGLIDRFEWRDRDFTDSGC